MITSREDEYVKALSNGDSKAFELLFLRYQPKLVYFFTGFVHDDEIAQDLAQDFFFNLWNNRSKLSDIRLFQSYLYQMARNILSPSVSDDPEEQLFASNLQELINLRVDQMPPQRRQIFRMSRMEGLNNEEIAKRLNINKRTVENHLTVALADLRKMLKVSILLFFH